MTEQEWARREEQLRREYNRDARLVVGIILLTISTIGLGLMLAGEML